jgi:Ca-activated chloride channel homolog
VKIDLTLDFQTIVLNEPRPVHLIATLSASKLVVHTRPRSVAFAVVLDRSGSMAGEPLRLARESCAAIVRNLRADDLFTLVVFDDSAQVVSGGRRLFGGFDCQKLEQGSRRASNDNVCRTTHGVF